MYIYIYLRVNAIVRLPHPRSGDSQGQETFLAPSDDKQTCTYDTECSNYNPSLSTLRSKGLRHSQMKRCHIYKYMQTYTNLPVNSIFRLPHPWSRCDYLKKTSIKINVVTDEGNSQNET